MQDYAYFVTNPKGPSSLEIFSKDIIPLGWVKKLDAHAHAIRLYLTKKILPLVS